MLIKLPGAENAYVNPDHIVAIITHSNSLTPQLKSVVALSNNDSMYSNLAPTDLFNQISDIVYNRSQEK